MTKHLDKIVSNMTNADWLQMYVISQVNLFETKFNTRIDSQEIENVCKIVSELELPEGVDLFVTLCKLANTVYTGDWIYELGQDLAVAKMHNLKLGQDVLVYLYSRYCTEEGYDERVAHIFKNCIQYTIPF